LKFLSFLIQQVAPKELFVIYGYTSCYRQIALTKFFTKYFYYLPERSANINYISKVWLFAGEGLNNIS